MASSDLFLSVRVGDLDLSPELATVTLDEQRGRPAQLTLRMPDPARVYGAALREGLEIEVELGTAVDHPLVFRGAITTVNASFPADGPPTLEVNAYDRAMRLGSRVRSRAWTGALPDLLSALKSDHAFQAWELDLPEIPAFPEGGRRQHNQTDLEFLLALAAEHNAELRVEFDEAGDQLCLRSRYRILTGTPAATLAWGYAGTSQRLLSFDASSDGRELEPPVTLHGTDARSGKALVASSSFVTAPQELDAAAIEDFARYHGAQPERSEILESLLEGAPALLERVRGWFGAGAPVVVPGFTSNEELKKRSTNLTDIEPLGMEASGRALGSAGVHAATAVRILGVNGRFSGTWFVTSARHTVDGQGHLVDFRCER